MKIIPFRLSSLFLALCFPFFTGCFSTLPVEIRKIDKLNVNSTGNNADISFDLMLHNPNNWGFKIVNVETAIQIDQHPLGKVELPKNFKIKRKSDAGLPIRISTTTQELLNLLPGSLGVLLGSQSMDAIVSGKITFGKFIFRKKYPFELKQKLDSKALKSVF